jgi:D-alanyl-D-alanine carboxypeptidase (penicillin-binding protein 5/6)
LAFFCASAICFWLFALAFSTAHGAGLYTSVTTLTDDTAIEVVAPATEAEDTTILHAENIPNRATETVQTAASVDLALNCRAAILIDQNTGTVLYEMNADERVPIASITKVMTLLLTFEAIHDGKLTLADTVPVSEHAYSMGGSQIWLEPGEQFTLNEMIKAICVASANDAAVAVAELVGGSESVFVERMNARAAELGMTNTTFRNACGLDTDGHLSTARDVAIMSRTILTTCPEVLEYTSIWTDSLRNGQTQLVNTNKLLKRYNGITGLKTGTTGGAGVCISASATRDGLSLIAVILGAPSSADRFNAATTLLDYGFANYEAAAVPEPDTKPLQLAVHGSAEDSVPLDYSAVPQSLLLAKGNHAALTTEITLPEQIEAPVKRGDTVGTVTVRCGEEVLGEYEICAAADAAPLTFGQALELLTDDLFGL